MASFFNFQNIKNLKYTLFREFNTEYQLCVNERHSDVIYRHIKYSDDADKSIP